MRTTFLDTQFVVALVNVHDEHHPRAMELSFQYEKYPLVTTDAVFLEIGNALSRSFRQEALAVIEDLKWRDNVTVAAITRSLLDDGLALYGDHGDKTWGLVDCISFVVMKRRRIREALTGDKHFEQAGFVALMNRHSESES